MEKGTYLFKEPADQGQLLCIFSTKFQSKKRKKKSGIEWLYLKTGYNSPKMFGFFLKAKLYTW